MRRRALPFLALLALTLLIGSVPPAAAQIREGAYAVEGQNPDGTTYAGALVLRAAPGASWLAVWDVGGNRVAGLGLIQGGVLAVSFTVGGRPGIAAYEVQEDGTLRGSWTTGGGLGTETLTPR